MNDRLLTKLVELTRACHRQEIKPETLQVFHDHLTDLDPGDVCAAIDRLIDSNDGWFPAIGTIRGEVANDALGNHLAEEALAEVWREVRRVGHNRPPVFRADVGFTPAPQRTFTSSLTDAAVDSIGWVTICTSDKPEIIGAQFVKAWNNMHAREVKAAQTGQKLTTVDLLYDGPELAHEPAGARIRALRNGADA